MYPNLRLICYLPYLLGGISVHLLKKSVTASVLVGPVLDNTGAAYTGMAIGDFNITKNGTTAAMASAAVATHSHNGNYIIDLTTGNTDTAGRLVISCNKSTYAMTNVRFEVLPATTFDALVTNDAGTSGGILMFGTGTGQINPSSGNVSITQSFPTNFSSLAIDSSGRVDLGKILGTTSAGAVGYVGIDWAHVNAPTTALNLSGTTVSNITNLPSIPSNWVTAAGIAASALNGKGDWPVGKTGYALTSGEHSVIAGDILNATAASYNTGGSIGEKLNAAASAGDPWVTEIPGDYAPGSAGFLVGSGGSAPVLELNDDLIIARSKT